MNLQVMYPKLKVNASEFTSCEGLAELTASGLYLPQSEDAKLVLCLDGTSGDETPGGDEGQPAAGDAELLMTLGRENPPPPAHEQQSAEVAAPPPPPPSAVDRKRSQASKADELASLLAEATKAAAEPAMPWQDAREAPDFTMPNKPLAKTTRKRKPQAVAKKPAAPAKGMRSRTHAACTYAPTT